MNLRDRARQYQHMQGRGNNRAALFGGDPYGRNRGGGGGGGQHQSTEHANAMLEAQNDAVIDQLYETASQIKSYSQTINRQAKEQNDLLNGMGTQMDKTQGLLGSTLKKMQAMAAQGGAKHMCYMVLFVLFMLWLLYWVAFTKRAAGPPVEVPVVEDVAGAGLGGGAGGDGR